MLPASLPPPVILRASARLHCFAYVDLRAYALIGHTPRSETPMVVQQADHMINVCMCVHRRKRGVWMEGKGGRDERRGEGGGGGVLWVAASHYISEGFLFQAPEMEAFFSSPVGEEEGDEKL